MVFHYEEALYQVYAPLPLPLTVGLVSHRPCDADITSHGKAQEPTDRHLVGGQGPGLVIHTLSGVRSSLPSPSDDC